MLEVQNLVKQYHPGAAPAVDNLSLSVQSGQLCGLVGPAGAGKTTALLCIAGILPPTSGTITLSEPDAEPDAQKAQGALAFLPHNPQAYEYLSGIRYLAFIADMFQTPPSKRRPRIQHYADAFGLTAALGELIGDYPPDKKQKLALVSVFMRRPSLMVLDEPFENLDAADSATLEQLLREACQNGAAVLYATRREQQAAALCHTVTHLAQGHPAGGVPQGLAPATQQEGNIE